MKKVPAQIKLANAPTLAMYSDESGFAVHLERVQAMEAHNLQYLQYLAGSGSVADAGHGWRTGRR